MRLRSIFILNILETNRCSFPICRNILLPSNVIFSSYLLLQPTMLETPTKFTYSTLLLVTILPYNINLFNWKVTQHTTHPQRAEKNREMCNEFQWMNKWNCKIARIFILHELWGEDKKSNVIMTQLQAIKFIYSFITFLSTKMYWQSISLTTEEDHDSRYLVIAE